MKKIEVKTRLSSIEPNFYSPGHVKLWYMVKSAFLEIPTIWMLCFMLLYQYCFFSRGVESIHKEPEIWLLGGLYQKLDQHLLFLQGLQLPKKKSDISKLFEVENINFQIPKVRRYRYAASIPKNILIFLRWFTLTVTNRFLGTKTKLYL